MKQSIQVSKTAHYYLSVPKGEVCSIVFVIHGYAQLASDFIEEFTSLKNNSCLVVAPEALSRFYNKERKPVANWMTSHERESEIEDYIGYLNQLKSEVFNRFGKLPISVLGFSQGVSTTMRWIQQNDSYLNEVHLCSGSIPPELNEENFEFKEGTRFYYYYGDEDRLLKAEKAKNEIHLLSRLTKEMSYIAFRGRHEVPKQALENLKRLAKSFEK